MAEARSCGTCGRYVDLPVEDGDPGDRIGVCPCAWRVDLMESRPLFDGLYPGDEACDMWAPEQSGERKEVDDEPQAKRWQSYV